MEEAGMETRRSQLPAGCSVGQMAFLSLAEDSLKQAGWQGP